MQLNAHKEYFNAMNLFWDHHSETDGPQCKPAIVRGPRFIDSAVRVTRCGFC